MLTWGKSKFRTEIARSEFEKTRVDAERIELELKGITVELFHSILYYRQIIQVYQKYMDLLNRLVNNTSSKKTLDIQYANLFLTYIDARLKDSHAELTKRESRLSLLIGKSTKEYKLTGTLNYEFTKLDEKSLIQKAFETNSELKTILYDQKIAENLIKLSRNSNKPRIALISGYNIRNGFNPTRPQNFYGNWAIGFRLSFPIFEPFPAYEKTLMNYYKLYILKYKEVELKRKIETDIKSKYIDIRTAEDKIRIYESGYLNSQRFLNSLFSNSGKIQLREYVDILKMSLENELMYYQSLYEYIRTRISLCKSIEDFSWFGL